MKIFAIYLLTLVFSFGAYAFENAEKPMGNFHPQLSQVSNPVINIQDARTVAWSHASPSIGTMEQIPTESQDELLTELSIYTLIILAYSLYWLKNNDLVN